MPPAARLLWSDAEAGAGVRRSPAWVARDDLMRRMESPPSSKKLSWKTDTIQAQKPDTRCWPSAPSRRCWGLRIGVPPPTANQERAMPWRSTCIEARGQGIQEHSREAPCTPGTSRQDEPQLPHVNKKIPCLPHHVRHNASTPATSSRAPTTTSPLHLRPTARSRSRPTRC